jgi:hypothetical protein
MAGERAGVRVYAGLCGFGHEQADIWKIGMGICAR